MEIKIVRWSGYSANEGLNLGAGMQRQFVGNRRRRSGEDRGFHGTSWCRRKQFREPCGTHLLAPRCGMSIGSFQIALLLTCAVEESFAVPRWTPPGPFWPLSVVVIQANQPLARFVLFLVQRKQNRVYWIGLLGGPALGGFAWISWWDPRLAHCHHQFRGGFHWDDYMGQFREITRY